MNTSVSIDALDELLSEGVRRGIGHLTAEDDRLNGRTVILAGADVVNFASCSYLGLELDERVCQGAIDAVRRYGTQFASSRTYISAPPYGELESLLSAVFDAPALCTPTTTLGHLSALPVLVDPDDLMIVDQMAHTSVQLAVHNVTLRTPPQTLRHNRMDVLEQRLRTAPSNVRVWYLADGVYSMYGDRAPTSRLNDLQDRFPNLYLYIDDAHGMSWLGHQGSGSAVDSLRNRERVVVAVSLVKAFGAGGAAITCVDGELIRRVRTCGSALMFSGPIQPPMLGASIASARIHLTPEISRLQAELRVKLHARNTLLDSRQLPVVSDPSTPICFVAVGRTETAYRVVERLLAEGFYTNPAVFPAVSMRRAGIRFTVTRHHTRNDIANLIAAIARVLPQELEQAGDSLDDIYRTFKLERPTSIAA